MRAWEKNVRTVVPYVPGEQPNQIGMIKLNTNENPYPPAPGVMEALKNMDADSLRRYPDPAADALVSKLAKTYHVAKEQIFVGVGSDDVLAMCFLTFFQLQKAGAVSGHYIFFLRCVGRCVPHSPMCANR